MLSPALLARRESLGGDSGNHHPPHNELVSIPTPNSYAASLPLDAILIGEDSPPMIFDLLPRYWTTYV